MKLMKTNPAELAQLAMMLEVCAETKPGNVDRYHDYEDTFLEHFLASAILVKSAFENAANYNDSKGVGIGKLIYDSVNLTNSHSGGNTHFGAFILLIPLIAGCGIEGAKELVGKTTVDDAVFFYKAFGLTKVRMNESDDMDVNDPNAQNILREKNMTLYDVMEYSSGCDMVSNEWISGFELTRRTADYLLNSGKGKDAIPDAYMSLLATHEDTFVTKKLGSDAAFWTKETARKVVSGEMSVEDFDLMCLEKGINPGSVADIIIAGIFIALMEGWEWDF